MVDGARTRALIVTVPMGGCLVVLLGLGVLWPDVVDPGPGAAVFRGATGGAGALAAAATGVAALRTRGRLRASWTAIAATVILWTLAVLAALLGHPVLAWWVLRPASAVTGTAALLLAPGVRRRARDWALVVLDGWLVGGSVFLIGWLALFHTGSRWDGASPADRPSLLWIPVDLLFVSVVSGLAMRTDRSIRLPVLMMVLVSLLTVTGDCTWSLADGPPFAVLQWIIMMLAFAASTATPRLDLWRGAADDDVRPRLARWPQVAVVPGLAAAVSGPAGPLTATVAISVIVAMVVEILLVGRENLALWHVLAGQAERLDLLVRESRDAIVQVDGDGTVEFANEAVADVLGCGPDALVGRPLLDRVEPDDRTVLRQQLACLAAAGGPGSVRVHSRFRRSDGALRVLEATVSRRLVHGGYTLLARDVTERVGREAELRRLARCDTLTGLLNRHAFLDLLAEHLGLGPVAVLYLDLDGFKAVNDAGGHAAGDRLLVEAAQALHAALGAGDVAARLGGDEFAVLVGGGGEEPDRARGLAAVLVDRLGRLPSDPAGATGASIGVAVGRGMDGEELLARADRAMYRAKAGGGGRYAAHDPGLLRRRVTA